MKIPILISVLAFVIISLTPANAQSKKTIKNRYPEFSWKKVPVYLHFGKRTALTEEELEFVAAHSDFICFEKGHGSLTHGSTEKGIEADAVAIKKLNPKAKVIFYWNTFLDYSMFEAHEVYNSHPQWWLRKLDGELDFKSENLKRYDLSNPEVRKWYTAVAKDATDKSSDGIFMDAFPQILAPGNINLWGEEKYRQIEKGLYTLIDEVREGIGEDKLIVCNNIRNVPQSSFGMQFVPITDASTIEHFGAFNSDSKESMARDIEDMIDAGRQGKIVIMKGWPGFNWTEDYVKNTSYDVMLKEARKNITFPLACFLIAAQPYSYFCYSWGYQHNHGMLDWYPEFDKPLGKPRSDAVRNGWEYSREFKHCKVWVNLETREGKIDWKK
jgi:hypothetical protein